jgi:hypothetical protein
MWVGWQFHPASLTRLQATGTASASSFELLASAFGLLSCTFSRTRWRSREADRRCGPQRLQSIRLFAVSHGPSRLPRLAQSSYTEAV